MNEKINIKDVCGKLLFSVEALNIKLALEIAVEIAVKKGSDLSRADLSRAIYGDNILATKIPIQITGLKYPVLFLDDYIKIGYELHSVNSWINFGNEEIRDMYNIVALDFWSSYKDIIIAIANRRKSLEKNNG